MDWKVDFIKSIANRHILVVGDVMLDKYLWGRVTRISPEAPVPILNLGSSHSRLGGAANVALNLASLGSRTSIVGVVGSDPNSQILNELLIESGIDNEGIVAMPRVPTTTKTRVIAGHQHLLRVDDERFLDLSNDEEELLLKSIRQKLATDPPDAIILQDYNKGVLTPRVIRSVIDLATKADIPVAVDPKFDNFFAYSGATIFKPNLKELSAQFRDPVEVKQSSLDEVIRKVADKMQVSQFCVTLSEHGIYISNEKGSAIYPTESREVVDVCGAGDAVISVLTLACLAGLEPYKMALLANSAGGSVCGQVGVAPVTITMLQEELGVETFL